MRKNTGYRPPTHPAGLISSLLNLKKHLRENTEIKLFIFIMLVVCCQEVGLVGLLNNRQEARGKRQ